MTQIRHKKKDPAATGSKSHFPSIQENTPKELQVQETALYKQSYQQYCQLSSF